MERDRKITRRAALSAALAGLTAKGENRIAGGFVNEALPAGHMLRDHAHFPAPARQVKIPVLIVGGGMAGLSAAWQLERHGFKDFVLLEMDRQAGGNSRSGENEITRFPWGAHYVPVPPKGESLARELFEEMGVYRDGRWEERALCFAPQERLFLHGRWQEGLEPELGVTDRDRAQYKQFGATLKELRATGQFTIPMEAGARPSPLDQISASQWLERQGFDSQYLRWYMNYSCRDDYGASSRDTSAWAGIHYFASREPEEKGPLTWPEGNGFLAHYLIAKLARYLRTNAPAYAIKPEHGRVRVLTPEVEYAAETVIFAAPTFLAHYLIEGAPRAAGFQYSPWLTANLTLERAPREVGAELAWDNVIYESPALGYVDATHMSVATVRERQVWTYYYSLADLPPVKGRELLLGKDWTYWRDWILHDLGRAHADIAECVSRIDIMRMGHAMVRPATGFIFSDDRARWLQPLGAIHFANSDLSGFSIFEEAQFRGVRAADWALKRTGGR